jgi:DNA-binding CsgD family transcriptional regulator
MRRGESRSRGPAARVTARESEILAWVAAGKSDWAIGQILQISGKTVNFHVENAKRKLGVGTRVQAVIAAMRSGVIGP